MRIDETIQDTPLLYPDSLTVSSVMAAPGWALSDTVVAAGSCELDGAFGSVAIDGVIGIGGPTIDFLFTLGDVLGCCGVAALPALGNSDSGRTSMGEDLDDSIDPGSGMCEAGRSEEIDWRFLGCGAVMV